MPWFHPVHWHLLTNQLPFALGLISLLALLAAWGRRPKLWQAVGYVFLGLTGLSAVVAVQTGQALVRHLPPEAWDRLQPYILRHASAARSLEWAGWLALGLGALAWALNRYTLSLGQGLRLPMLLVLLALLAGLTWVAMLGGEIRHPLIR